MNPSQGTLEIAEKLAFDPWSIPVEQRQKLMTEQATAQTRWLAVLTDLVEPPAPGPDFPAFLLDSPAFDRLRNAIHGASSTHDLDTATADELQRFVDCYRGYLTDES